MKPQRWIRTAALVAAVSLFSSITSIARADDSVETLYDKGKELFASRDSVEDDRGTLDTIALLSNVFNASAANDAEKVAKYRALCLLSRAYYFAASNTDSDNKKKRSDLLEKGMGAAKAAAGLSPEYADAYYFYAINLSRWGITQGIGTAIKRREELNEHLRLAISKKTVDGEAGESIDGYGPLRVRGRAAYKLPPGFGRNDAQSMADLKKAAELAPYVASNQIFYAATLNRKKAKDKDGRTGKAIVEMMIAGAKSPEQAAETFVQTFNGSAVAVSASSRLAETKKDFREDLEETAGELRVKLPW